MDTITRALKWLWDHKALSGAIGAGGFGLSLYTYLTGKWNRALDLQILKAVQLNGPMIAEEISGRVGKSLPITESRLWDLLEREKITHNNNNAKYKSYWGPVVSPLRIHK